MLIPGDLAGPSTLRDCGSIGRGESFSLSLCLSVYSTSGRRHSQKSSGLHDGERMRISRSSRLHIANGACLVIRGSSCEKKQKNVPLLPVDTAFEALHPRCSPCAAERARVKVGPGACTSDTRPGHIQRGYADGVTKSPGGGEGATAGPITG